MTRLPLIWPSTADAVWQAPTSDGWSVAVHHYGHGDFSRPAVMLLHGALANSRSFDIGGFGLAPYLRDRGCHAFAVDFRGRGYSQAPKGAGGWTVDDLIRWDIPAALAEIRRRTAVERVHAVGHSLGGMALYGYLVVDGAGIDKVVTISASATLDIPAPLRLVVQGLSHFSVIPVAALGERAGFLARWIPHGFWRWCCNPRNVEIELFRRFLTCGSADISVSKMLHLKRICEEGRLVSADGTLDYSAHLGRITNPIRLLGAAADTIIARRHLRSTEQLLVNAPRELLWCGRRYGCRHDYGHLDMVIGQHAPVEIYPKVADFFLA